MYSNLHLSPTYNTQRVYFQNNENGKTGLFPGVFLELTDDVKNIQPGLSPYQPINSNSIWGTPVHTYITCCYHINHGHDREKVLL